MGLAGVHSTVMGHPKAQGLSKRVGAATQGGLHTWAAQEAHRPQAGLQRWK